MGATPPFQEGGTDLAPFLGFGTAPAPFLGIGTEAPPGWDLVLFTSPRTHRPAPGDAPTDLLPILTLNPPLRFLGFVRSG